MIPEIKNPCDGCFYEDLPSGCKYKNNFPGYNERMCSGYTEYKKHVKWATEYHKVVKEWLFAPCTEHPDGVIADTKHPTADHRYPLVQTFPEHRYQCPECINAFKGE